MKNNKCLALIVHFLPFWFFAFAIFISVIVYPIEYCLRFCENKKLLYDFQDSWMWNYIPYGSLFISFALSFIWMFLIFFLWRKKSLVRRWCCSIGFLLFPFLTILIMNLIPRKPEPDRLEFERRVHCAQNLHSALIALTYYTQDNNGSFPDSMEIVGPFRELKSHHFSPDTKEPEDFSDYIYYGKGKKVTDPVFVLLEDKPDNHRGNCKLRLMSNWKIISVKKIE